MKRKLCIILYIMGFLFIGIIELYCQSNVKTLDFRFNKFKPVENYALGNIVNKIECIPLEFSSACLLGPISDVFLTNEFVILNSGNKIYMFSRDGDFLDTIAAKGRGPEEYTFIFNIMVNNHDKQIYLVDMKKILVYDYQGKYIRSFEHPNFMKKYRFFNNSIIVADRMVEASDAKRPYILYFFDTFGKELEKIQTRMHLTPQSGDPFMYDLIGGINYGKQNLCFIEQYGDTIYTIQKDMQLHPVIRLNYGRYKFTQDMNYNWNKYDMQGKNFIKLENFALLNNKLISLIRYDHKDYYTISSLRDGGILLPVILQNKKVTGGFILKGTTVQITPYFGKGFLFYAIPPQEAIDNRQALYSFVTSEKGKERLKKMKAYDNPVLLLGFY